MTIQRTAVDRNAIPTALLDSVKQHLRVRHARDDALITRYIASAVSLIERKCNVTMDPTVYVCTADELGHPPMQECTWSLPVNNVHKVEVNDEQTPPVDHAAAFQLWNPDYGGNGYSYLVAINGTRIQASWTLKLEAGLVTPADDMSPAFFALLARMVGSLYETREASAELYGDSWADELAALWRPCA